MAKMDKNRGEGSDPEEFEPLAADNDRYEYLAEEPLETDQLDLDDSDERLPWLESDDDFDGDETDGGRVLGLVIMGLVALATIVGGIWWATNRAPDPTLVADGSTIAAPAAPYKTAPKDPGGKTFDGTGNTAYAVSEGQTRPARLGEAAPKPPLPPSPAAAAVKPGFDVGKPTGFAAAAPTPAVAATKPPSAAPSAAPAAAPVGGPAVQVGAYSTRASAEAAWSRLAQRYSALSGVRHQTVEGKADIGTVFRLQALPGDGAAAQALCGRLKASGLACQVK